jgi:hypothetical protein
MPESSIFGVSVRAWLSLITVGSGLAFLYTMGLFLTDKDIRTMVIAAVIGFINLALGYYLGQKGSETTAAILDVQEPDA